MQKTDAVLLAQHLNGLAETYDRKPVTVKALEVWFETLKEFPTEKVCGLLIAWPRHNNKFPTPADLWKSCNEIATRDREAKAAADKALFMPEKAWVGPTPKAEEHIARIRQLLGLKKRDFSQTV